MVQVFSGFAANCIWQQRQKFGRVRLGKFHEIGTSQSIFVTVYGFGDAEFDFDLGKNLIEII